MVTAKDVEKEEKEKKEKEEKEEKKVNWFQKVPTLYKLGGVAIIFVKYLSLVNKGGNISELYMWMGIVVVIWFFLGSEGKRRESDILMPREAEDELWKEINRKIKNGQINRFATVYVGPNNGLFHHEGLPQHYQIGVEIISSTMGREYKRGIVFAEGPTRGYATLQDSPGKLTGREPIPVISPLPNWLKRSKKYDLDIDKYIFGGGK